MPLSCDCYGFQDGMTLFIEQIMLIKSFSKRKIRWFGTHIFISLTFLGQFSEESRESHNLRKNQRLGITLLLRDQAKKIWLHLKIFIFSADVTIALLWKVVRWPERIWCWVAFLFLLTIFYFIWVQTATTESFSRIRNSLPNLSWAFSAHRIFDCPQSLRLLIDY